MSRYRYLKKSDSSGCCQENSPTPLRSRYFTKIITTLMKPCHMFGALSQILYLSKSSIQITEVYAAYNMPPCTST